MSKRHTKIKIAAFSLSDQMHFAHRLSLLLKSGISMSEALSMMQNMENCVPRKHIYDELLKSIQQGISLSKSIRNSGIRFNGLLVSLIQNGESTGSLSETLLQAYSYLEKRNEMKKKLITSLLYPMFIIFATIAMTLFLVLYIFPKIIPLLSSLDIKLPLITRIVQGVYYFSLSYGLLVSGCILVLIVATNILIAKSVYVKSRFHRTIISLPLLSSSVKTYLMSSVCRMGEIFLSSGKSVPDFLLFTQQSTSNIVYKIAFGEIYEETIQGVSLSVSIKKRRDLFPLLLSEMSALGEKTGNLAQMLGHCSRIFDQDIDDSLKRFSSLIEPTLMVLMGLIVGSVALSIILPVYEITNHLTK
ncbi:MAG: type pilus assembly protein PilC [Patescibacteria group bacterium]|nr:type pilus assembly protein PilC [Patescibacteria group bacterium]